MKERAARQRAGRAARLRAARQRSGRGGEAEGSQVAGPLGNVSSTRRRRVLRAGRSRQPGHRGGRWSPALQPRRRVAGQKVLENLSRFLLCESLYFQCVFDPAKIDLWQMFCGFLEK